MKKIPLLYARGNNGKVLEYQIEVDGKRFRTTTGAQGFQHVTSEWTICEGKNIGRSNETSPNEQAYSEALAKWEKKLKSGGYWKNIKDIDTFKFVEPMLAYPMINSKRDRTDTITYPCMVDRKYNGGRVIITKYGAFTRTGEKYNVIPHIVSAVEPLFELFPDLVLDGEGYNHDLRYHLNELMSILRTTKNITEELLKRSEQIVKFYIYDGYGFGSVTEESGCNHRRMALQDLMRGHRYCVWVPFNMAMSLEDIYKSYEEYVEDGYEGAIIRNAGAPYQHKRTNDLLKIKPEDDDEAVIIKISDGVGGAAGLAAKAKLRTKDGREFEATFRCEEPEKVIIFKNQKDWIGKEVTYLYNGLTGKGIPNFARIDTNNCFKK